MAKQVQFRRGTTTQHGSFTGALGEITIDTDKNTIVVHDGSTVGGIPLAKETAGTSANNFAGAMANAANSYAASLTPDLSPVFLVANAAFDKANAANVLAYNALPKTGGTVAGDLVITGNVTISGETTYANTQTLLIGDNIFVMNADIPNNVAPSEDAGMEVNRGSSSNVTLNWRESTDKWVFTNDGTTFVNIASNTDIENVGTAANNFAGVMANASNAYADSLTPDLSPVFLVANAAFDKANAANVLACTAFDAANTKVSSVTGTAGQIFSSGGTTPTLNLITTAVTSAIYGGSTQIPVINIDSYGRITSASNVEVQGMDYAYVNSSIDVANAYSRVFANSVGEAANTYANNKVDTITSNSTSRIWANSVTASGIETVYMDLAASGVSATTYGASDTVVPYFTVDAYGRITSAGNTTVANAKTMLANTTGTFAGDLTVTGNVIIDTSTFVLNKNANYIGLGRTNPGYTLDVVGTVNASNVLVNGSPISANLSGYATNSSPSFTGTVTFNANLLSQTLTDGASIAWDVSLGQIATVTLGGNRTLSNPTNLKVGTYILHVVQDGNGNRTLGYGSAYKWAGGVAPVLTTTASARDLLSFVCDGTNLYGSFLPDVK